MRDDFHAGAEPVIRETGDLSLQRESAPASASRPFLTRLYDSDFPGHISRQKWLEETASTEVRNAIFERFYPLIEKITAYTAPKVHANPDEILGLSYPAFCRCCSEYNPEITGASGGRITFEKFLTHTLSNRIRDELRKESPSSRHLIQFQKLFERARTLAQTESGHKLNPLDQLIIDKINHIRTDHNSHPSPYTAKDVSEKLIKLAERRTVSISSLIKREETDGNFEGVLFEDCGTKKWQRETIPDDPHRELERHIAAIDLQNLSEILPPRERDILYGLSANGKTLKNLGEEMTPPLTESAVCQLKNAAFKVIRVVSDIRKVARSNALKDYSPLIPPRVLGVVREIDNPNASYDKFSFAAGEELSIFRMLNLLRAARDIVSFALTSSPNHPLLNTRLPASLSSYCFLVGEMGMTERQSAKLSFPGFSSREGRILYESSLFALGKGTASQTPCNREKLWQRYSPNLSNMQRLIYSLVQDHKFSFAKAARALGMNRVAVRQYYLRAKEAIEEFEALSGLTEKSNWDKETPGLYSRHKALVEMVCINGLSLKEAGLRLSPPSQPKRTRMLFKEAFEIVFKGKDKSVGIPVDRDFYSHLDPELKEVYRLMNEGALSWNEKAVVLGVSTATLHDRVSKIEAAKKRFEQMKNPAAWNLAESLLTEREAAFLRLVYREYISPSEAARKVSPAVVPNQLKVFHDGIFNKLGSPQTLPEADPELIKSLQVLRTGINDVMALTLLDELSQREISQVLKISTAKVEKLQAEGRRDLLWIERFGNPDDEILSDALKSIPRRHAAILEEVYVRGKELDEISRALSPHPSKRRMADLHLEAISLLENALSNGGRLPSPPELEHLDELEDPLHRRVVFLYTAERFSFEEIAALVGKSRKTVSRIFANASQALTRISLFRAPLQREAPAAHSAHS